MTPVASWDLSSKIHIDFLSHKPYSLCDLGLMFPNHFEIQ